MRPGKPFSLWEGVKTAGNLSGRFLSGASANIPLSDVVGGSCLEGRAEELRGRSVLLATRDHLATALALIELDGIACRLVLCPADLPIEHVPFVIASVPVDAIVTDLPALLAASHGIGPCIACSLTITPARYNRDPRHPTEWILLTSGTTGQPKMVAHTLSTLIGAIKETGASKETGAIKDGGAPATRNPSFGAPFYDIRRYGGLQIFLRAVLAGGSLVLSGEESTAEFLIRAGAHGVTHISGTPSHWRRALMCPSARRIDPQYVRLSGEIADQSILDQLRSFYPQAIVVHAFASTEAGVAFEVRDGLAGCPASVLEHGSDDVEMKIEDGSLRIRSSRTAVRYIGPSGGVLADADGFVDTSDMLERRNDRYYFMGRRDGVINVGGLKVHPEEVEVVINRHPQVRMSLVRTKKNPIVGSLVVADVVLNTSPAVDHGHAVKLEHEILQFCRGALPRYKVPAAIHFVSDLAIGAAGKIGR